MRELSREEMLTIANGGSVMEVGWSESLSSEGIESINRWLGRGDGVAVYANADLGHGMRGHCKFVSFGSTDAQLETESPPETLPDMVGQSTNWRYRLCGVYRGEQL